MQLPPSISLQLGSRLHLTVCACACACAKGDYGRGAVDRIGRRCQVTSPYGSLIFIHSVLLAELQREVWFVVF